MLRLLSKECLGPFLGGGGGGNNNNNNNNNNNIRQMFLCAFF